MEHNFRHLSICIYGMCETCKQFVTNTKTISVNGMKHFTIGEKEYRAVQTEINYLEITRHKCEGEPPPLTVMRTYDGVIERVL